MDSNTNINLQNIPSQKSIYIQSKSLDNGHKLCEMHERKLIDVKYSKSQIKSLSTLPSKNYIGVSETNIQDRGSFGPVRHEKVMSRNVYRFKKPQISKIPIKSKRLGQIYTNSGQISAGYRNSHSKKHQLQNSQIQHTLSQLQDENIQLRSKLMDNQLKQRDYKQKINKLQIKCLKLEEIICRKQEIDKNQKQFVKLMREMFSQMFGVSGIKGVWKKQKEIVEEWVGFRNREKLVRKSEEKSDKYIYARKKSRESNPQAESQESRSQKIQKSIKDYKKLPKQSETGLKKRTKTRTSNSNNSNT